MTHFNKILIVDDEIGGRKNLEGLLIGQGYTLEFAENGKDAIAKALELIPDLVLLDVMMPGIDGFEVCRHLRSDPVLGEIPIVMVTSLDDHNFRLQGLEAGADDFISKPFNRTELRTRVQSILRLNRYRRLLLERIKFERLVELAPIGITIVNTEGTILLANPMMAQMVGAESTDSLSGKTIFDFITLDQTNDYSIYLNNITNNPKQTIQAETIMIRANGEIFPVEFDAGSSIWDGKEAIQIVSRDITQRKEVENQIREQAALLNIAHEAIFVLDSACNILFWNKGAEVLYGWTAQEAINKNAGEIISKPTAIQRLEASKCLMEKGKWSGELQDVTKDGRNIIVESRWVLMQDEEKKQKKVLIVNTDITDKKELEIQFLRAQRMDNIGALASGIAHDLNNVLAPFSMSIDILRRRIQDERTHNMLNLLENSLSRGVDLIKQVLSFGRGTENKRTGVQVKNIITEIEKILRETFSRLIEIQVEVPEDLWTIDANTTQIHQVLMNLCINARDAMSEEGRLCISAYNIAIDENYVQADSEAKIGNYVVISVSDSGTGIAADMIDKIFDPFFTTKEIGKGTGLGLATVVNIVKNHEGFIKVISQLGEGTEFKIFLPATKIIETQKKFDSKNNLPLGNGDLILVVDDEASIREITKTSLELHNYRVLTTSDGLEALAVYAEHKKEIALVLTDMMMPIIDCPKTIQALQKINPTVKIIVMSGITSATKVQEVERLGVKMFLPKPYTIDTLLKVLAQVLSK